MQAELSTWRPLWDFAMVLSVLGLAAGLSARDRASWWLSQGLLLLSAVIGFAAASVTHAAGADLFSLGVWVLIAWGLSIVATLRPASRFAQSSSPSTTSVVDHD